MNIAFETSRLKCRQFTQNLISDFVSKVQDDAEIKKYFRFEKYSGSVYDFFNQIMHSSDSRAVCIFTHCGIPVGYINGYIYLSTELLVEYFIFQQHRGNHYTEEALTSYINFARSQGFNTFRFDVEPSNISSKHILEKMGATHIASDDFDDEEGRHFLVYKIHC